MTIFVLAEVVYSYDGYKTFRNSIITQLGGVWLFLDDCPTHLQNKYFPDLIEQAIEVFQANNESAGDDSAKKPLKEFSKPVVEKIGDRYFFIAGSDQIFHLNDQKNDDEPFAIKLSREEVEELEVQIVWTGSSQYEYDVDEKEAFDLLCSIIHKMNLMQDEQFHSVILGKQDLVFRVKLQLKLSLS